MWDEFFKNGIMGIGWDEVTNLKDFASKEEIKEFMKKVYDASYSYKNNAHCLWQFANEIKVGDVVFVKKGMHKIIGMHSAALGGHRCGHQRPPCDAAATRN